jgi:hypothetical protein
VNAKLSPPSFETLFFVLDYFDGPIAGVASFQGLPHYFAALFDKVSDSYADNYHLTILSNETLRSVRAARECWRQRRRAGHKPTAVELEKDSKPSDEMEKMIARDCTLSSPLLVRGDFVRLRETGTDEESFAVTWTPLNL